MCTYLTHLCVEWVLCDVHLAGGVQSDGQLGSAVARTHNSYHVILLDYLYDKKMI